MADKTKHKTEHQLDAEAGGNSIAETVNRTLQENIRVPITKPESPQNGLRQEIAYLQYLMRKYPGPAERFHNEAKSA